MVILNNIPKNVEDYFMADGDIAFKLHQAGFIPIYKDSDVLYFRKNHKLIKYLSKIGIEV